MKIVSHRVETDDATGDGDDSTGNKITTAGGLDRLSAGVANECKSFHVP